jgi:hypothetical protein
MNKIYCMVHADGFSFKAFGINFGARTNQNSALDGLKSHLLPGSTLTKTETAGRRYSFVIQNRESRPGVRHFHLLLRRLGNVGPNGMLSDLMDTEEGDRP